jgi:hypothetical protein
MTDREFIKFSIQKDKTHLLDKKAIEDTITIMYQDGEVTVEKGKFYLNDVYNTSLTLDEFVVAFRLLFMFKNSGVRNRSGNFETVKKKARRFQLDTKLSYEEMLDLGREYTKNYRFYSKYLVDANNFFYKQDKNKVEASWAKRILDEEKVMKENRKDF